VSGHGSASVGWPHFLPDGRHFLYFEFGGEHREGHLMVGSLDANEKPVQVLQAVDSLAQYAPPGYVVYVKDGTLVAQRFDASALKIGGEPVPIAEQMGATSNGLADFSVSDDGVLVYRGGASSSDRLVWLDRTGKELSEIDKPSSYGTTALSPDGTRLAIAMNDSRSDKSDIWVRDLARGVTSRLTFDPAEDANPVWSPDGSSIVFSSDRKGPPSLFEKNASGTGAEKEIWSCGDTLVPSDWSRDGRFLLVNRLTTKTGWDLWVVPLDGKSQPFAFIETPFSDLLPAFSPDGHYVAYMSNETSRYEIYVQQFPGPGGKWQVSANGGVEPHWSADGKTIYYRAPGAKVMAASVQTGGTFTADVPRPLFEATTQPGQRRNSYLVTRDGQKFLVLSPLGKEKVAPLTVVLHWPAALKG
jgi:Tol biopolymer transport system component